MKPKGKRAEFIAKGKTADILIYDDIGQDFWGGGISAKQFTDDLKALGNVTTLNVFINSYGGSVFEGLTIYNQLVRHPATVNVSIDGLAASIASVIAMAGDQITIAENAMMMVHKPYGGGIGTADDLRQVADALDKTESTIVKTYAARSGQGEASVQAMVNAETWLTAEEAIENGLADAIGEAKKMAAYADLSKYNYANVPARLPSAIYTVQPAASQATPGRQKYQKVIDFQKAVIKT